VYHSVGKCLYISLLNLISLDLYLYIIHIKENQEIMNHNKEIYSVLKFTVVRHIVVLLFAVLQWH
jgi:hypothetical protein